MINIFLAIWLPMSFTIVTGWFSTHIIYFLVLTVFGVFDVIARLREYLRFRGSDSTKVLEKMRHSACQRNAIIAALKDKKIAKNYYKSLGYRWYHFLPDGTFSIKNNCYLKLSFYLNLMGLK